MNETISTKDAESREQSEVNQRLITPSHKETLGEVLSSMFVIEGNKPLAVLVFIISLALFGWTADSLLPIVQELALRLGARWFGLTITPTDFSQMLVKAIMPTLIFICVILFLFFNRRRNKKEFDYSSIPPDPHKGLIIMLSPYRKLFNKESYDSADEVVKAIDDNSLDLDKLFSGCNWGQLAFVVKYHAPVLQHCWVVITEGKNGSASQFVQAEKLIKHFAELNVECHKVEIKDQNEISETASAISTLYRNLTKTNTPLAASDVIADFTGGTSAMSGGMVIATLNENEKLEYVKQGIPLTPYITRQQVYENKLIISPRTSLRMAEILTGR